MRLLLASTSARRAALLREAGLEFEQAAPTWSDPPHPPPGEARQVAMALARRKAMSVPAEAIHGDVTIIGADTLIVNPDGRTLVGTPQTIDEARTMIKGFLNARHDVVTGVALWRPTREAEPRCFADSATVWVGHIGQDVIEAYLASGQWQGKAGGYNLFERQAAGWPIEVNGDPSTVVGLPLALLLEKLER